MSQISYFFGHILKFFYDMTANYALSIVFFTILTRIILLPLTISQMRSMSAMKLIQPEIDKINKKYKNDRQKQSELLSKLYRENNINPAAGCLPLLIQLPIITAMYSVVREPIKYVFSNNEALYKTADVGFFWINHLTDVDKINIGGMDLPFILPVLSAIFTYIQLKMSMARSSSSGNEMAQGMSKNMSIMMPVMMLIWGVMFPAGLMLYWVTGTIVQIIQQYFIGKYEEKIMLEKKDEKKIANKSDSKKVTKTSSKSENKK